MTPDSSVYTVRVILTIFFPVFYGKAMTQIFLNITLGSKGRQWPRVHAIPGRMVNYWSITKAQGVKGLSTEPGDPGSIPGSRVGTHSCSTSHGAGAHTSALK